MTQKKEPKMGAKKRRHKDRKRIKRVSPESSLDQVESSSPNSYLNKFMDQCYELETSQGNRALESCIKHRHEELFGDPGQDIHIRIRYLRVCYELQLRGHKEEGCEDRLPSNFWQNYEAAKRGKAEELSEGVKALVELLIKFEETRKEKRMAKKKVKKIEPKEKKEKKEKKSRTESAQGFVKQLLWNNNKTKLSDAAIQKKVLAKFPGSTAYKRIKTLERLRDRLNSGEIKSYGKPKTAIKKFNGKKKK